MEDFAGKLKGGDLRMLRGTGEVTRQVHTQREFDALFKLLFHHDRLVVMRAADGVEKITRKFPMFLAPHAEQIFELTRDHAAIELKWHLAQLLPRLTLHDKELIEVWNRLKYWATNRNESKIVRVNSLEGMFQILQAYPSRVRTEEFRSVVAQVSREHIPSIDARIRKLRKYQPARLRRE